MVTENAQSDKQWTSVLLAINNAIVTMGTFQNPLDESLRGLTWGEWQLEQAQRILKAVDDTRMEAWVEWDKKRQNK